MTTCRCVGKLLDAWVICFSDTRRPASDRCNFFIASEEIRPDLPLYDDTAKIGLGLWNYPVPAFSLEAALLFGGMVVCFRSGFPRRVPVALFGAVMLAVQALIFFGPPPASDRAAAVTALAAYFLFALIIWRLERRIGAAHSIGGLDA